MVVLHTLIQWEKSSKEWVSLGFKCEVGKIVIGRIQLIGLFEFTKYEFTSQILYLMIWTKGSISIKVEDFGMKAKLNSYCLNLCRVTIVCMEEQLVNIQCMGVQLLLVVCYRVQLLRFTHTWILVKEVAMAATQLARATVFSTHTISSPIQLLLAQVTQHSTMVPPFP